MHDGKKPAAATPYDGPTGIASLRLRERWIHVVRPAEPDRLLDERSVHQWNQRDDYMPYWAYLWPGAYLLADAIAREAWADGLEALEIGCGLGLAGLAAMACGLRVQFSDYDATPLRFVDRSVLANRFDPARYATRLLDWRALPAERFPVILGADVLYERRLVPLVARVIDQVLAPGGQALLAGPYRRATEDLPGCLEQAGLAWSVEHVTAATEQGDSVRGTLHRVWRRG